MCETPAAHRVRVPSWTYNERVMNDTSLFITPADAPLAARMRPRSLDEFVGQEDVLGPGR